jgi:hypothetical protein
MGIPQMLILACAAGLLAVAWALAVAAARGDRQADAQARRLVRRR